MARETVRAYRALFPGDEVRVVEHGGQRYSLRAQLEWPALKRAHPDATWIWFHWDLPWFGVPERSVVYIHDLIYFRDSNPVKRMVARAWVGHALRTAGRIVTVSQATLERIETVRGEGRGSGVKGRSGVRGVGEGSITVIPNGVARSFAGRWTPGEYVLAVGEDRPYKNFALLPKLGLPWKLASGRSDEELNALYAGARAVIVPSREEGFGLPVLEAFARGVPVVASDIPALREVAGGLATLVPVDDLDAWKLAVRGVWDAPADSRAAQARRARAAEFTWERSARMLREVIEGL